MKSQTITRRRFLKATGQVASAVAFPYVITSSALGSASKAPASERIALGHIGVGGQGGSLMRNFLRLKNSQSVAVCDVKANNRQKAVGKVNRFYKTKNCAAYNDFRKLLARDDIDAVVIATPDHWHVPIAIEAVKAGKDIYVEKPLGLAVAWNRKLRDVVNQYNAVFQYGTQQRSGRDFRYACEIVRNGYIGKLEKIDAWCPGMAASGWYEETVQGGGSLEPMEVPDFLDYDMWLGPAPKTPFTKDRCTQWGSYHVYDNSIGFIAGWGAHPLDIAQWGNDTDKTAPVEYKGTGRIPEKGLYNTISDWDVHCKYANGVKMHFINANAAEKIVTNYRKRWCDHGTTFFGSEGWISVDRQGLEASSPSLLKIQTKSSDKKLYESNNHYKNFIDCVKSRNKTISTVEVAVQSDIISHLGDITIRLNRKIKWDPEKEMVVNDAEAQRMLDRPMRSPWRL